MTSSTSPPGPAVPPAPDESRGTGRRKDGGAADKARVPDATVPTVPPERPLEGLARVDQFPAKLGKKQRKALKDAHRALDSWERYRALTDVLDEASDLVDLADHKARFALVIMAALNVVLFFVAVRTDLVREIPSSLQPFIGIYMLAYALVALYFFLQAIESLRPRKSQPNVGPPITASLEDVPLGIRFFEDILRRDVDSYKRVWRDVRVGQLNAELAVQAHALASINREKYTALRRLYLGLKIMTLLAVGLVGLAAAATVIGTAKKVSKAGTRGAKILGQAERLRDVGVKEPSGVAFNPANGHLYVVGDEGSLAELDGEGKTIQLYRIEPQIEDVTVHAPTGSLILVSETRSELLQWDPGSGQVKKRWPLDRPAILGSAPSGNDNQGFEGLVFKPEVGRPGGGVFYLTHQRGPAMVVALAFDPAAAPTRLGAESVIARWTLSSYEDLTAVTYVPTLDRLVVVADAKDRMLVVRPDTGAIESEVPIPGRQQEGIAFDAAGTLWLADDLDKSVLKIKGGLEGLTSHLAGESGGGEEGTAGDDEGGKGKKAKKGDLLGP